MKAKDVDACSIPSLPLVCVWEMKFKNVTSEEATKRMVMVERSG